MFTRFVTRKMTTSIKEVDFLKINVTLVQIEKRLVGILYLLGFSCLIQVKNGIAKNWDFWWDLRFRIGPYSGIFSSTWTISRLHMGHFLLIFSKWSQQLLHMHRCPHGAIICDDSSAIQTTHSVISYTLKSVQFIIGTTFIEFVFIW